MAERVVFFSWMSDLPNATNRGLIRAALEKAAKRINERTDTAYVRVESDTEREIGSPDVINAILTKIRHCDVFVADVSFMPSPDDTGRRSPNPNVMMELGFGLGVLGHSKVLMVFNQASGHERSLPFDLGFKRQILYSMNEADADRAPERNKLSRVLEARIREILDSPAEGEVEAKRAFVSSLADILIEMMITFDELEDRPSWDTTSHQLHGDNWRERLDALAESPAARDRHDELSALATACEEMIVAVRNSDWPGFRMLASRMAESASKLKTEVVDPVPVSNDRASIRGLIADGAARVRRLADRADMMMNSGRVEEVQSRASEIGWSMLRLSHFNFDIPVALMSRLRAASRELHLVDALLIVMDGGLTVARIRDTMDRCSREFDSIATGLGES